MCRDTGSAEPGNSLVIGSAMVTVPSVPSYRATRLMFRVAPCTSSQGNQKLYEGPIRDWLRWSLSCWAVKTNFFSGFCMAGSCRSASNA